MPYEVRPLSAPRLAGLPLRLVVMLAESRLTGWLVTGLMRRQLGVPALRRVAAEDPPRIEALPAPRVPAEPREPLALAALRLPAPRARLPWTSVAALAAGYRERRFDPLQIAERLLAACEAAREINAFVAQDAADVRAQAEDSAARFAVDRPLGPLDGVPVAVKDELDQRGYPTTVGTRFLGDRPAAADATAVARLRAAGALLVGKAGMHEIGIGVTGINPHHGAARNPYDPGRATGGSSSGSAAAVAAGLVPLALGADGGGSVRMPAALCGVLGLKPTYGRVSEHGAAPLCWSVAHVGPLAASATDLALCYLAIAGPDPADPHTWHQPAPHLDHLGRPAGDLRIGVYRDWFTDADPAVFAACDLALARLCEHGARLVEIEIPQLELVRPVHMAIIATEMAAAHLPHLRRRREYGLDVRINLAIARGVRAVDYLQAQRLRRTIQRRFDEALAQVDLIATPSTACTAPPLRESALAAGESDLALLDRIMRFAPAANLTGHPAISIPAGFDAGGLPIGLQLIGRYWEEDRLLQCAALLEPAIERPAPRVFHSLLDLR